MFAAIWHGFCEGLGFCLAVALTVGLSELKVFAKRNYDLYVGAALKNKAATPVAPAAHAAAPVETRLVQPAVVTATPTETSQPTL